MEIAYRKQKSNPTIDYLLMFVLMMVSGNPACVWRFQYILFGILLFFKYKRHPNDKYLYILFGLLFVIFLGQYATFGTSSLAAHANLLAKIFVAFSVVKLLGSKFREIYLDVLFFLCIVSLFCFTLYAMTGVAIDVLNIEAYKSCFLWCIAGEQIRNGGYVWEPGAFAGYILFAFILYIDNLGFLFKKRKIQVYVLLLTLLTTMSTTGYVVLLLLIGYYLLFSLKNRVLLILIAPLFLFVASYALSQEFMQEKITKQFDASQDIAVFDKNIDHGRFASAVLDAYYIEKHPLIGNGFDQSTRYADHLYLGDEALNGFGNGFTGFMGCMGVIIMIYFLGQFYMNKILSKSEATCSIILLVLLLFGETYMNYPFIYAIPFFFLFLSPKGVAK